MANSDAGRPSKRVKTSDAPLKSILKKTSSSADPVKETERTTKTLSVKSQVPDKAVHSKFSKKVPKQKKNVERDVYWVGGHLWIRHYQTVRSDLSIFLNLPRYF